MLSCSLLIKFVARPGRAGGLLLVLSARPAPASSPEVEERTRPQQRGRCSRPFPVPAGLALGCGVVCVLHTRGCRPLTRGVIHTSLVLWDVL